MIIYTVACRGSLNTKGSKCFRGGGWLSETPKKNCPHCGVEMFVIGEMRVVKIDG